jgi:putative ABC transport system substrate-binding protein
MPVVGVLNSATPVGLADMLAAFRAGLREGGFVEGQNVKLDYRYAEGRYDILPALATDLVQRGASIVVATGDSAWAAKAATTTIPIVFANGSDPVEAGLVPSLSRPYGNVTGVSWTSNPLMPKRLEILRDLVPGISSMAALVNRSNPSAEMDSRAMLEGARTLGLQLSIHKASTLDELAFEFAEMARQQAGAVVVGADSFFAARRREIIALAARHALPASYSIREYVVEGGLVCYAPDRADSFRLAGVYTARILKGERPADLPVQLPTKFQLVINLRTVRMLGLVVPPTLLARADEVIE